MVDLFVGESNLVYLIFTSLLTNSLRLDIMLLSANIPNPNSSSFSKERLDKAEQIKIRIALRLAFNFKQTDDDNFSILRNIDPQRLIEFIKIDPSILPRVIPKPFTEDELNLLLASYRYKGRKGKDSQLETRYEKLLEIEESYPLALELGGFVGGGFDERKKTILSLKNFAEWLDGGKKSELHELLEDANKLESSYRQSRTFIRHTLGFFYQKKIYKCLDKLGLIPENLRVGSDPESQLKAFFGDKVKYKSEMREPMLEILKRADVDGIWNNFVHQIWGHEYVECLGIVKYYLCRKLYN
jgi:hypothetical protein